MNKVKLKQNGFHFWIAIRKINDPSGLEDEAAPGVDFGSVVRFPIARLSIELDSF